MAKKKPMKKRTKKSGKPSKLKMWRINARSRFEGVPPVIAELTRRFHRWWLYAKRPGADPRDERHADIYWVEIARRGWCVLVQWRKRTKFRSLQRNKLGAADVLYWAKGSGTPRLSATKMAAVKRAAGKHRRGARATQRGRRGAAAR